MPDRPVATLLILPTAPLVSVGCPRSTTQAQLKAFRKILPQRRSFMATAAANQTVLAANGLDLLPLLFTDLKDIYVIDLLSGLQQRADCPLGAHAPGSGGERFRAAATAGRSSAASGSASVISATTDVEGPLNIRTSIRLMRSGAVSRSASDDEQVTASEPSAAGHVQAAKRTRRGDSPSAAIDSSEAAEDVWCAVVSIDSELPVPVCLLQLRLGVLGGDAETHLLEVPLLVEQHTGEEGGAVDGEPEFDDWPVVAPKQANQRPRHLPQAMVATVLKMPPVGKRTKHQTVAAAHVANDNEQDEERDWGGSGVCASGSKRPLDHGISDHSNAMPKLVVAELVLKVIKD